MAVGDGYRQRHGLGAVLALITTMHLAIDARREEIEVVSVMGGSAAFIRRPFLYTGVYFGTGGGVLASLCVWLFSAWLAQPVDALFALYDMATPPRPRCILFGLSARHRGLLGLVGCADRAAALSQIAGDLISHCKTVIFWV